MSLASLLQESRQRWPEKTAIWFAGRSWRFGDLDDHSNRIAAGLAKAGARAGDRIALFTPNCIELVLCYFGAFKLGAIAVPLNDRYQAEEVRYGVEQCGATMLIAHAELLDRLQDLPLAEIGIKQSYVFGGDEEPPFQPFAALLCESTNALPNPNIDDNDPAVIFYTSGSTARPKGVTHTHRSLTNCIEIQTKTFEFTQNDVHMVVTAACHVAAFATQLLPSLASGGTSVLAHLPPPAEFIAAIECHGVTRAQMLPAGLEDIVEFLEQHPSNKLQSWRSCTAGGDVIPLELQKRFRNVTGFDVTELYGQTEAASTFTNPPFGPKRPGSFGKPVVQTEGRVVDADGKEVADDVVGELQTKSPSLMQGYWNDPEATSAAIHDGWFDSGDLVRRDRDGYYWFVGRKKEIIIRGGSNISPMEVERVIDSHPAVHLCCVVGKSDTHFGQIVEAYVEFRGDMPNKPTADELKSFVAERIAAYKVPEHFHIVEHLPLNCTGKVDRHQLHETVLKEAD
jgi:long-chain acyl-CoA synthetase